MKKLVILPAAVCAFFAVLAAPAQAQTYRIRYSADDKAPISLENAIRLGLENNYQLLLTEQDVIVSQQRVKEAKFLYLPQLSVSAAATTYSADYPMILPDGLGLRYLGNTDNDTQMFYGVGAQATQYLYTGGRTSSTVSLANASLKEAQSRYEAVKSSVIFEVKAAFFEYLFMQHKQTFIEDIKARVQKINDGVKGNKLQAMMSKARLADVQAEVNKVSQEAQSAHLKLLTALNKELNGKVVIDGDFDFKPLEVDLAKASLWAMEYRPELKSALYKLEMDNISVKLSLAKRYPDILLGVGYDRLGEDTLSNENWQATLALKLPIGYDYGSQVKQKRAEQRQTILKRAAIEDGIRAQVMEAYNNLMFWQAEVKTRIETWDAVNKDLAELNKTPMSPEDKAKALEYFYKTGVNYLEGIKQHLLAKAMLELAVGQDF